jgi:hypothetical protein
LRPLPIVIGTAAAVGTGFVVSKGFKKARKQLRAYQQTRKALEPADQTLVLQAAQLEGNGQPIAEAIVVVD